MTIKFDTTGAMTAFQKHLTTYLLAIREELLNDAQAGMQTPEGRTDLTNGDIKIIVGYVSTSVIGGTWATMDEWGTGSLMDPENPALSSYRNSDRWNPSRYDLKRRGRPAGQYTDIFGKVRTSSGKARGLDLEQMAEEGKLPESFLPTPPSHAMRNAFRWMRNGRFQWYLQKAVTSFPWGKYLKVTNTKG
jgi:hypothetical protein